MLKLVVALAPRSVAIPCAPGFRDCGLIVAQDNSGRPRPPRCAHRWGPGRMVKFSRPENARSRKITAAPSARACAVRALGSASLIALAAALAPNSAMAQQTCALIPGPGNGG